MNKMLLAAAQLLLLLVFAPNASAQNANLQFRSKLEYPGQTLANICGYAADGREYALLGGSKGLIIVDVTNPDAPTTIVQIPGPDNLWKEIKTYGHYAYVTSEGGGGVQIVDMSTLPDPNVAYKSYMGDGAIAGQLNTIHALHIDVTKGFLYAYGSSLFQGGAVVLDLNTDPYNPKYVGKFNQLGYIHDGYVDNDTLYGSHIYTGFLSVVDMTNKANPVLLGSVQTPAKFTHNSWITDDRKHVLTTDETLPSFVTSYDVSDPSDIKELDRFSPNDGNNSIGHNTHILNDYAITSWYTDGVTIVDAHRPENLVMVGIYDTYPQGTGPDFEGCWGVYPYLPSGNLITSNITPGELFILTPTYQRACYLEGVITDGCSGFPLLGATIDVASTTASADTKSNAQGVFKTGQAQPGNFAVTISKPGYVSQTVNVILAPSEIATLNITLEQIQSITLTGTVVDEATQQPLANLPVTLAGTNGNISVQTNANGVFSASCVSAGTYQVVAGQWGYVSDNVTVSSDAPINIALSQGYADDFATDYGWSSESTASSGDWTRAEPLGTYSQGNVESNPETDIPSDFNDKCYVTGNEGTNVGSDDVDNGTVTLTCPPMKLAAYQSAKLSFWYWFRNFGGDGSPNDNFEVSISNGGPFVTILDQTTSEAAWRFFNPIEITDFVSLTDNVRVRFQASDGAPGHIVEGGLDGFLVVPGGNVAAQSPDQSNITLQALPNPSGSTFQLLYDVPASIPVVLEVFSALGQLQETRTLGTSTGSVQVGAEWPKGTYMAVLKLADGQVRQQLRLVKI
jgi:choice-of-anchor B domain-containing protein